MPGPFQRGDTAVLNSAAIYFDFNEPGSKSFMPVKVYPNPFITETTFEMPENVAAADYRLTVLDETGRLLRTLPFDGNKCLLHRGDLPAGALTWSITANGAVVSGGTIVAF